MKEQYCIHCFVSGKVQGVWFRAGTKEEAEKLGLTGWVKNLPDGRVEVLACGEKTKVIAMREWLNHGPRLAEVAQVELEELEPKNYAGFQVL